MNEDIEFVANIRVRQSRLVEIQREAAELIEVKNRTVKRLGELADEQRELRRELGELVMVHEPVEVFMHAG